MPPKAPKPNTDDSGDEVKIFRDFIQTLKRQYSHLSNHGVTVRVFECLIYIKINPELIQYAVEHPKDVSLYKYKRDITSQVLRAKNDMSFHVFTYTAYEQAKKDYASLMNDMESAIKFFENRKEDMERFLSHIKDSPVGCLEERISPARTYYCQRLSRPDNSDLQELMSDFVKSFKVKGITDNNEIAIYNHALTFFIPFIDEPVFANAKCQRLNFTMIKDYLADILSLEPDVWFECLREQFTRCIIVHANNSYYLYFPDNATAESAKLVICGHLEKSDIAWKNTQLFKSVKLAKEMPCWCLALTKNQYEYLTQLLMSFFSDQVDISIYDNQDAALLKLQRQQSLAFEHEFEKLEAATDHECALLSFNAENKNILHQAIIQKDEALALFLISHLPKLPLLDIQARYNGDTALMLAVKSNRLPVFDKLMTLKDIDITGALKLYTGSAGYNEQMRNRLVDAFLHQYPKVPSFYNYCRTAGRVPNIDAEKQYLQKILNLVGKNTTEMKEHFTQDERDIIKARMLWSQYVHAVDQQNIKDSAANNYKSRVIKRLIKHGHTEKPEEFYEQCLKVLADKTVITFSFNASKVMKSEHLRQLNGFENNRVLGEQTDRIRIESILHNYPQGDYEFDKAFEQLPCARIRYGNLQFIDGTRTITSNPNYGKSFLIYKHEIRHSCLFYPTDSYDSTAGAPVSAFHLDRLFAELPDRTFDAMINIAKYGFIPGSYHLDYNNIEAFLPPLHVLDAVEFIYIDPDEHRLTIDEKSTFEELGIAYDNSKRPGYHAIRDHFYHLIESHAEDEILDYARKNPSVWKTPLKDHRLPIFCIAEHGLMKVLTRIDRALLDPSLQDPSGRTIVHFAARNKNHSVLQYVLKDNDSMKCLELAAHDGMTPLHEANLHHASVNAQYIIKHSNQLSSVTNDGLTPLCLALQSNDSICVELLFKAGCDLEKSKNLMKMLSDPDQHKNSAYTFIHEVLQQFAKATEQSCQPIITRLLKLNASLARIPLNQDGLFFLHILALTNQLTDTKPYENLEMDWDVEVKHKHSQFYGYNVLDFAIQCPETSIEVLQSLVDKYPQSTESTLVKKSCLQRVVMQGDLERVRLFLKETSDVNILNATLKVVNPQHQDIILLLAEEICRRQLQALEAQPALQNPITAGIWRFFTITPQYDIETKKLAIGQLIEVLKSNAPIESLLELKSILSDCKLGNVLQILSQMPVIAIVQLQSGGPGLQ